MGCITHILYNSVYNASQMTVMKVMTIKGFETEVLPLGYVLMLFKVNVVFPVELSLGNVSHHMRELGCE